MKRGVRRDTPARFLLLTDGRAVRTMSPETYSPSNEFNTYINEEVRMFRLIKLAMLALFGYALYEFFRGALQDTQLGARMNDAFGQLTGGQGEQERSSDAGASESRGMNITGPGAGTEQATLETNGGSVRHKVGRGVVS